MNESSNFFIFPVKYLGTKKNATKQIQKQTSQKKKVAELYHDTQTALLSKKTESTQEFHNVF